MTGRTPPEWAQALIEEVCTDYGRRPPKVQWWERKDWYSSGVTYKSEGRIHVTAGTSVVDARIVLLHELAHWIARPNWHHNRRYWELAWAMYQRYADRDLEWAIYREAVYVKKSLNYCPLVSA
jgi:hypothetical protein